MGATEGLTDLDLGTTANSVFCHASPHFSTGKEDAYGCVACVRRHDRA